MTDTPTNGATRKPSVLFVCIHNAGRSQMAAGWTRHLAGDRVHVRSAGSEPAERINPMAVQAMDGCGDSDGERCAEPCGRLPVLVGNYVSVVSCGFMRRLGIR